MSAEAPGAVKELTTDELLPTAPIASRSFDWARHRNYVLFMLFVAYFLNSIDRNIVNILQQSIKAEFGLLDWQLGMMTGFTFALFYTSIGLPVARLIDGGARRTTIVALALALALWSVMTALCGMAQNFWQLLIWRAGVGVGEGSFGPPGFTLISDYFGRTERARAMGIFLLGLPIGSLVGLASGGWIAQHYGWRAALMIVGIPGLAVALIFKLTVREPPRGLSDGKSVALKAGMPLRQILLTVRGKKTFLHLIAAASLASFSTVGGMVWFPPFLMRSFGLNAAQIGLWWGIMAGLTGIAGSFGGGWLADRLGARNPRYILLLPAVGMCLCLPFYLLATLSGNFWFAFAFLLVPATLNNFWLAPAMALTQGLAPLAMRALLGMFVTFAANLIGPRHRAPVDRCGQRPVRRAFGEFGGWAAMGIDLGVGVLPVGGAAFPAGVADDRARSRNLELFPLAWNRRIYANRS